MRNKKFLTIALMAFGLIMSMALPALAKDPPDWAVGTFTGRNPNGGGMIRMTITSNGSVTADFGGGGSVIYGTLDDKTLRMNGSSSKITKLGNGIRTTAKRNGRTETIDYRRSDGWGDGGGNGGNDGGWGNGSNPPSWAQGTFYGTNPQNGGPITMTVQSNGNVSIVMSGNTSYGTMTRSELRHSGYTARVSRIDNGIRTTSNGESINYYRTNNGGGWNPGQPEMGQVPSWAIGTFRGTNPQNGTPITITIYSNGVVNINMNGYTNSASMFKDQLNNNGSIAKVTRLRNGIRTTSNGQSIDYYK